MSWKNTAVPLGLASALCVPAMAVESDRLETLVVSAAREPIAAQNSGSSVTVLNEQLLEQRQTASLAEILRAVPGVAVSRVGVLGSQTQLRLRGGEANQVLVFIDGIRANDPAQNSEFNMAHLLNIDLESVEVIRGPQSALWGSDALSGVINITTRRAGDGGAASIFAEGGSDSWRNYGLTGGYGNKRLNAAFSASSATTDGDNISRSGSEKDGYENTTANGSFSYQINDQIRLEGNLRYVDANNHYDGTDFSTGLPADSRDETDTEQVYGRLALHMQSPDGRWRHSLRATNTDTDNRNTTENSFAAGGFERFESQADVMVLGYQGSYELLAGHSLTAAYERINEDFSQRGPVGFGDPNRDESMNTDSFIFEYRAELGENISLLASARHDNNSEFDDKTTGRISGAWRLPQSGTRLRAAWGKGVKNPTFVERFGFYTDFIGNPDLQPEESTGWEIGLDQRLLGDKMSLSASWFDEELEDEINGFVFVPAAPGFTAENENGTSRRQGLELSAAWQIVSGLQFSAAYTYLDATEQDTANSGRVTEIRRPKHIANANLNWSLPGGKANLNLNIDYSGQQDDLFFPPLPPYQETVEIDEFTLVGIAGSYQLLDNLQLFARVENALDENYEEVYGYAAPGRGFVAGLRYRMGN